MNGRPTFTEMHGLALADETGGGRPAATIRVPATFNASPDKPRPLVMVAASRNVAVTTLESSYGLTNLATQMDAIVLLVNGKTESAVVNSWNANLCCCWTDPGTAPDDSGYLASRPAALIAQGWSIDTNRIYGIGQGGAGDSVMYRSACDHPDVWTAIVGVNGAGPISVEGGESACPANLTESVAVAHAHGTLDTSQEPWTGQGDLNSGMENHCHSAIDTGGTMDQLAAFAGCTGTLDVVVRDPENLSSDVVSQVDTDFLTYTSCPVGREVELWRINGEDHTFTPTAQFVTRTIEFFQAHTKGGL